MRAGHAEAEAVVDAAGVTVRVGADVRLTRADLAELVRRIDAERQALHQTDGRAYPPH